MYILMLPVLRKIAKFMVKSEWILIVCIYVVLNTLVFFDFVIWKGEYTHNSYMTCFTMSEYVIYPLCGYYLENRINIDKINDHSSVLVIDRIKTQIIDYFRWFFNSDNI